MKNKGVLLVSAIVACLIATAVYLYTTQGKEPANTTPPHNDYKLYELQGDVKSVTHLFNRYGSDEYGYSLSFDYNGTAVVNRYDSIFGTTSKVSVLRNTKGEIYNYSVVSNSDNNKAVSLSYIYDEHGIPAEINSIWYNETPIKELLTHNDKGHLTKKESSIETDELNTKETVTYRYVAFDKQGNWTERVCTMTTEEEINGSMQVISVIEMTEKRVILYY